MSSQPASEKTSGEARVQIMTNSNVRYEGILYRINPTEKTIALKNVRSFGTEDRVSDKVVPSSNIIYEFIVFRSSEIKDLMVFNNEQAQGEGQSVKASSEPNPVQESKVEQPQAAPETTKSVQKEKAQESKPVKKEAQALTTTDKETEKAKQRLESAKGTETVEVPAKDLAPKETEKVVNEAPRSNRREKVEVIQQKGAFNFDDMIKKLGEFEKARTEKKVAANEKKYESSDFFDSISTSVTNPEKRPREEFQDRRSTQETFGNGFRPNYAPHHSGNRRGQYRGRGRPRNHEEHRQVEENRGYRGRGQQYYGRGDSNQEYRHREYNNRGGFQDRGPKREEFEQDRYHEEPGKREYQMRGSRPDFRKQKTAPNKEPGQGSNFVWVKKDDKN